jgi:GDP-4-dehydro-6-deoxy-D-mannose reductase
VVGRILVTGATGFVGRHLLAELRRGFPGATLIAARHGPEAVGWDATLPLPLDDGAAMAQTLAEARPAALIHLAAQASVGAAFADPAGAWRVNTLGTVHLIEALRHAAPACRCLFVSTAEVYGLSFQSDAALTEAAALRPANPYAASKAAAEFAVSEAALRGLPALIARPFNHSGAGQSAAFVLPAFARQIARIEAGLQPPEIRTGALDRWREMLDVRDICRGYARVLARFDALPRGTAFNLASGRPHRIGDLLEALLALAGLRATVHTDPALGRPTDVARAAGDAALARRSFGWAPEIPLETTLASVLADWRQRVATPGDAA